MLKKILGLFVGLVTLLTACSPAATSVARNAQAATRAPASGTPVMPPEWFSYKFTDPDTGSKFSVDDLKGKVILVETMAMWCTNCHAQQEQILALNNSLGTRTDFVSLSIDIDINEKLNDLKSYVATNGFTWTYAVASPGVAREIGQLYGQEFLNPPSTPMLIIDQQGGTHPLPFGIKSADDLRKDLAPYLPNGA